MPFFNSRRALTALTLATLLSASPVLAQGRPRARTDRAARPAATFSQLRLLDLFRDTLSRFVAGVVTSGIDNPTPGGDDAGVRIDPEGYQASPSPAPGPGMGHP